MDYNFNPNMWEGMFMGEYARATFLPDFVLAILKANCSVDSRGDYIFASIFSNDNWPNNVGDTFTLD
jgi:hypothetical protein